MDTSKSGFDDPESLGKSESAASDPSSATGIFGTVSSKPISQQDDDLLKSLMGAQSSPGPGTAPAKSSSPDTSQTQAWSPVVPPTSATPASTGPGEFTQTFQALEKPASAQTSVSTPAAGATPPPATAKAPDDLASVFTQVVVEKTAFVPPLAPPAASKPGEFTQLLQTLNASTQKPETEAPPAPQPPAERAPGTFTQMFNAVSAKPPQAAQTGVFPISSPPAPAAPPNPESAAPGEFTSAFQSAPSQLPIPSAPQPHAPSGPGSFTQMFSARPIENTPAEDPLKSLKPEPARPVSTFQFPTAASSPNEALPAAQGGFTQLLQALNKEESPKPAEPMMATPPLQPAPSTPAAGGFTQLMQTLSAESTPKQAPSPAVPPVQSAPIPPPNSGGPGEFTRIISGSQLRDLQAQNAASGPPVAPLPQGARPAAAPIQFPQPPAFPSAPAMPQMPAAHGAAAPPPAMPHFQPPAFQFPPAPAPAAPPPPASKLQQYLPLILILNIFVLLVIVLILIFVLRHH